MKNQQLIDKILYDLRNMQPIPSNKFYLVENASRDILIEIIKIFNILLELVQDFFK
jgi:uncharacterized protein YukJ